MFFQVLNNPKWLFFVRRQGKNQKRGVDGERRRKKKGTDTSFIEKFGDSGIGKSY